MDKETREKLNKLYSNISDELLSDDIPTRDSKNAWKMLYRLIDTTKELMTPVDPNEITKSDIIACTEYIKRGISGILNNTVYKEN